MVEVAQAERENALGAQPLYAKAPWLDVKLRTDGRFSACADMIEAKVAWLDRFLADASVVTTKTQAE
jgi:hypothetical protein